MRKINHSAEIVAFTEALKKKGRTIGFVPTMGALHKGHLALIRRAKEENDIVICSIFVNPLQFNKKKDFETYPNRLDKDSELLQKEGCDIVFLPEKEDLYGKNPTLRFEFGEFGSIMEGEKRPGHFEGMAAVIKRFFELIEPTKAYFGEKDYQQLAIVRWLNQQFNLNVDVVGCETVREKSGLAMSSRNLLLTEEESTMASSIYSTLVYCKTNCKKYNLTELQNKCRNLLSDKFEVEYFTIADENTLQLVNKIEDSKRPRAFVAARIGAVRLIDNLSLID